MANAADARVTVELDRARVLRYDLNAFAQFEEATGQSIIQSRGQIAIRNVREMIAFVWVGLLGDDPTLTLDAVGRLITPANMVAVMERASEAFNVAVVDPASTAEKTTDPKQPPMNGTKPKMTTTPVPMSAPTG